jgi:hypothetical protein
VAEHGSERDALSCVDMFATLARFDVPKSGPAAAQLRAAALSA